MPASRPKTPGDPLHPRATGPLRSFGRIKSRAIKPLQAALFDTLMPQVRLPDPSAGPIDVASLMPGAAEAWLEIGFGGGEHLAAQAAAHPDALMIGCEPFLNGVASALRHIDEGDLKNVRLHADDARAVVEALPDAALDRIMILFPDPWHKARHNKRRLIQPAFAADLARVLKTGGRLRFVTDWKDYAGWALERFLATPGLVWTADEAADWRIAPADHVVTRYEEKRLGDTDPLFLEFEKV
ncbi:tRNA (guanosine(46)-N7)-methyltransferase TrmB [Brevundimonas sp. LM2]|uniref:tRNA (guanosine(46)-N7)-methyltransferase TrmB n=1 Tax=Brevundimonas sp. LM2 TaxID=1938605 RepID=UPI000983B2A4|nr:tRNA (guanosine(46)-N7)-methyltransferase TrmB [Brevundimonas sp. LM2]AQR60490.1 tRNA (guanosine(46)-N7)-methyltransferase TrmB [Brevundimonas sp. LM2]